MGSELRVFEGEVINAGTDSAWMRRHLSDSVYLWACGEKANNEDDDLQLSDRLIGWLILFMQGFAYSMLVVLAGATSNSDTNTAVNNREESGYILPTVTGAMYLLVASTAHDLRAGFSLMVDGSRAGHRAFGIGVLILYVIMIDAAMTVLVSTSDNTASVVLNAVTVLFVADLDEKALRFLLTVPPQWRLFWAVESIGISFALALIAIYYIGDSSPLLEGNNGILQTFPTWFVWGINPASVTLCSVVLSSAMQAVCDLLSEALENAGEPKLDIMVASCFQVLVAAVKRGKERFKLEPCFHVALLMWFGHAVARWATKEQRDDELPVAVFLNPSSPGGEHARLTISDNTSALVYSNVVLVIGLALHALRAFLHRNSHATVTPEPRHSLEAGELGEEGHRHADSRVPSLLVGTGVGYWVSSLLYVLGCSWHGGGCGWNNVPIAVVVISVISYVVVPLFFVGSIFMVADLNILGTRFGTFVKPVVDMFRDRRTVAFWAIATVFRDFIDVWIGFCRALMSPLLYYV